ncbi:unnamed protein product [Prorocentrum cordatum]|uniref:Uncharacterized protein n=1 Tax=Prorocentrum cordatum TaxID=2364126 RepID=A0ABN9XRN1_9DINO|nr:unnamed protein product [Polarella glacialis]
MPLLAASAARLAPLVSLLAACGCAPCGGTELSRGQEACRRDELLESHVSLLQRGHGVAAPAAPAGPAAPRAPLASRPQTAAPPPAGASAAPPALPSAPAGASSAPGAGASAPSGAPSGGGGLAELVRAVAAIAAEATALAGEGAVAGLPGATAERPAGAAAPAVPSASEDESLATPALLGGALGAVIGTAAGAG